MVFYFYLSCYRDVQFTKLFVINHDPLAVWEAGHIDLCYSGKMSTLLDGLYLYVI